MQFVEKQQQKNIKLIDGSLLADLLVKYEVGVAAAQTFKLYNDDLVMQIVETSYAYGFEAFSIEKENWDIAVLLRKYDLTRQDLEQYCAVIAAILTEKKFSVLIYNGTQVQYQIIYDQRRAEIYRYIVRDESHSVDEKGWRKKKRISLLLQTLWNAIRKK